jgi:multidrug efflux pump subunit AcrA (membrane-fusion protein)
MSTGVDLRKLAVRRNGPVLPAKKRHWLSRVVLPLVILAGFAALAGYALRDRLSPPRDVTIVPVVVERGAVQAAGAPLFQAAGWIEPRPTPIVVTALTDGVIEKLLVVEGQAVKAGEPIAHLVDADARIVLQAAEAELKLREAEVAQAKVVAKAAKIRLDQPVHLEAALAEAAASLARAETERANLPFQIRAAEARHELAKTDLESKQSAGAAAVPGIVLAQAKSELSIAAAVVEELKERMRSLDREITALMARRDAVRKQLTLKTEETRQFDDATAAVVMAEARVSQTQAVLAAARLRLERLTIKAPQAGRVLSLSGRPGKRVGGLDPNSMVDTSTIAVLYDPAMLQVRADVPLDQVGKVVPGQPARIETEALPGKSLDGIVLQPTGHADVQKNTLQVKVMIVDPPAVIKPEMLGRVTFLAAAPPPDTPKSETNRFFVSRSLVETGANGSRVWIAESSEVAQLRSVKLGGAGRDDLVEVIEGLGAADKLIAAGRDGLTNGARIKVTGEDANLGVPTVTGGGGKMGSRR